MAATAGTEASGLGGGGGAGAQGGLLIAVGPGLDRGRVVGEGQPGKPGQGGLGGGDANATEGGGGAGLGGAVFVLSGQVSLDDVVFDDNQAEGGPGGNPGAGLGGAIFILPAALASTVSPGAAAAQVEWVGTAPVYEGNSAIAGSGISTRSDNVYGGTIQPVPAAKP